MAAMKLEDELLYPAFDEIWAALVKSGTPRMTLTLPKSRSDGGTTYLTFGVQVLQSQTTYPKDTADE